MSLFRFPDISPTSTRPFFPCESPCGSHPSACFEADDPQEGCSESSQHFLPDCATEHGHRDPHDPPDIPRSFANHHCFEEHAVANRTWPVRLSKEPVVHDRCWGVGSIRRKKVPQPTRDRGKVGAESKRNRDCVRKIEAGQQSGVVDQRLVDRPLSCGGLGHDQLRLESASDFRRVRFCHGFCDTC